MNKKFKMIGIVAAALLAVAPVVSTTVNAADATQTNTGSSNTQNSQATTTTNNQITSAIATTNDVNSENPVITYNGKSYDHDQTIDVEDAPFNYMPLNSRIDLPTEIKKVFTATSSSTDKTPARLGITYPGYFNNAIAGKYPLIIIATNKSGKSTKLTCTLTVGAKDSGAKYAIARGKDGGNLDNYKIQNGKVTNGGKTISSNTELATFGTITVNGISYTRLNGPDSDLYIETNCVNGTYPLINKPNSSNTNTSKTVTKTLMHTAIAYDADGHATKQKYYAFRRMTFNTITSNIKGSLYYMVTDNPLYFIKASNIDGTKRTLKKNAYIYSSSRRRTSFNGSWKLTKGSTVTTYGGSFRFRNGKRYYRIGGPAKQYVRVENFN